MACLDLIFTTVPAAGAAQLALNLCCGVAWVNTGWLTQLRSCTFDLSQVGKQVVCVEYA